MHSACEGHDETGTWPTAVGAVPVSSAVPRGRRPPRASARGALAGLRTHGRGHCGRLL